MITEKIKIIFVPCKDNNCRPKFLESRVLVYFVALLLVLKLFTLPFFLLFSKNIFFAAIVESSLIKLTNQQRQSLGLEPLTENQQLKQAALLKAKDMLQNGYFAHQSPEGFSPWYWFGQTGYNYRLAGENLAIGFLDSEQVHQAWLASPSHLANLVNPNYRETGIAVLQGNFQGRETTMVVQLFGSQPSISQTQPPPKPSEPIGQAPAPAPEENLEVAGAEEVLPDLENKLAVSFLSFLASDFYNFLQKFIYGFLILIILALILNVFIRFDVQHPDLILKTAFFVCLLIVFLLIDKVDAVNLISRNFAI